MLGVKDHGLSRRILVTCCGALLASCSGGAIDEESVPIEQATTTSLEKVDPPPFETDEVVITDLDTDAAGAETTSSMTVPPEPTAYEVALQRFISQTERSLVDRPDEHDGPMVKFLYVVPSFGLLSPLAVASQPQRRHQSRGNSPLNFPRKRIEPRPGKTVVAIAWCGMRVETGASTPNVNRSTARRTSR